MPEDAKAKEVIARYNSLKSESEPFRRLWQDIRELIMPNAQDFQTKTSPGQERNLGIYDSTAPDANKDFAAALHSYMTSPTDRWFNLEIENEPELNRDPDAMEWLEYVSDLIFSEFSNDATGFNSAMQEVYLGVGSFGTPIVYQDYDFDIAHLNFRACALADSYLDENSKGRVDVNFRRLDYTARQLVQEFGSIVPTEVREAKDRKVEVIHAVYPRTDRVAGRYDPGNKPFASCWVLREKQLTLKESGFNEFPYHIARWSKIPGQVYGIGPGQNCLPDVRMLNRIQYTLIQAAQKRVSPPMIVPDDGFLMKTPSASPQAMLYYEAGSSGLKPEYLEYTGDIPVGMEMAEQLRESIRRAFFGEWVRFTTKKERQTQFEIQQLIEQQLRMMAPMTGRLGTELLGPLIARSYGLLQDAGRVQSAPELLQQRKLKVIYVSPAARAQLSTKAIAMGQYIQELVPVAQIQPNVMDKVDLDAYADELAIVRGVSRRVVRNQADVDSIRQQRAEQEQASAIAGAAEPVSKAVLNLSQAQEAGNIL
jgi:hypothetical protein